MREVEFPEEWRDSVVGNVFKIQLGKMLSGGAKASKELLPYLANRNVQWGRVDLDRVGEMGFTPEERALYLLRKGDLLVCEGGEVGRTAIWNGEMEECYFQNAIHRLRARDPRDVVPRYFLHFMAFAGARGMFGRLSGKTSIAHLTRESLAELKILLPPRWEQDGIAEVLDSADACIGVAEANLEKVRSLGSGVLSEVFGSGDGKIRVPLGSVASVSSGATPSREVERYWKKGVIPWVRTGEVNFNGIKDAAEKITQAAVLESSLSVYPPGSVVVAMYGQGGTRGRSAILDVPAAVNQACAVIRGDQKVILQEYLYYFMVHSYDALRRIGQGSNQTNLNSQSLGDFWVPTPSIDEQKRAVAIFKAHDERIAAEKAKLEKLRKLKAGLMDDLLTGRVRVKQLKDLPV